MSKAGVKGDSSKPAKTLRSADFVHLHNHSHYSVLDGLTKIPQLIERVKSAGMEAVAVTDHGTMSGSIEFYQAAKAAGIKPIIGMEAYVAPRSHTDKDPQADKQYFHLILLAMNNRGYQNLMRLTTIAHLDGFYYRPRIDKQLLKKYNEGLIVLSGCIGGEVGDALRSGQYPQAKKAAEWYKSVFGDRYYLELQDYADWEEQRLVNEQLKKLGSELDLPLVVTSDAHYATHKDQEAHELLLCIQTGAFYADEGRMSLKDLDLSVEVPAAIFERWGDKPEVILNTRAIADRCNVELSLGNILIPRFPVPQGEDEKSYLHRLAWQGLAWRYGGKGRFEASKLSVDQAKKLLPPDISERALYELGIIGKMGFDGYFLIVSDFVKWGKEQGIVFGPGRGSAAGSIISYALQVTDLDPIAYDLLFERFLNPDRISMPDIDIDIQDNRRDEVIRYVADKYGHDRVANIVTFGTMAARNAIRDVSRVLEVPYAEADRLAKMVPPPVQGRHIPLVTSIKKQPDLKAEYESNSTAKKVIDLAVQLEGTIRSHGVHAAGVVIAPDEIVKFAPLEMAQKGVVATQYSMGPIEDIGLLKMDFLGLSNLTIIKNALRIIKKVYKKSLEISSIPLDDRKSFELLSRGDTTGVFQLESSGMKRYLKELKPTVFDDVIAMVALYRPGPLTAGLTDKFIARKNGQEQVSFEHPLMEPALKNTYGVMVFQEQFMQIVKDLCGFSGGQADALRKAVGKKKRDLMAKLKEDVIKGALKNGVEEKIAQKFWSDLEGFADYAFNKSHAACYALIAYQTAYLKAHYPDAFMASLMTSNYDDTDKLAFDISECQSMGLSVLNPDINESFLEFAVVPDKRQIRFGLLAVKNVGEGAVEEILRAREAGRFGSVEDYAARVDARTVNRKALESLIKSGAFDGLEASRDRLLYNIDSILGYSTKLHKDRESGQADLFGGELAPDILTKLTLEVAPAATPEREQLQWERELLGIYLSKHPLDEYRDYLEGNAVASSAINPDHDGMSVEVGGIVSNLREITTKNGQPMAFVGIDDLGGSIELILFPKTYESIRRDLARDIVVIAKGKVNFKDKDGRRTDEVKIMVDEIAIVTPQDAVTFRSNGSQKKILPAKTSQKSPIYPEANNTLPAERLYIRVKDPQDHDTLLRLKKTLNKHPGATEAVLVLGESDRRSALRLPFRVDIGNGLRGELETLLNKESVAVK